MNSGKGNTNFSYFSYDQFNNNRETPPEEETVSEELPQLTSAVETVDATRNESRLLPTLNVNLHYRRVNLFTGGFSAPTPYLDSRRTDGSSSFTPAPPYFTQVPPYIENSSRNAAHLFGSSSFTPAPSPYLENSSRSVAGLFGSSSFKPAPPLPPYLESRRIGAGSSSSAPPDAYRAAGLFGSSSFTPVPPPPYLESRRIGAGSSSSAPPDASRAAGLFGSSSFTPAPPPPYLESRRIGAGSSSSASPDTYRAAGLFGSSSFTPPPPPYLVSRRIGAGSSSSAPPDASCGVQRAAGLFGSSSFTPAPPPPYLECIGAGSSSSAPPDAYRSAGLFGSSSFTPPPYLESRRISAGSSSSAPPDASRAEDAVMQGMPKTEICHFWQSNRCTRGEHCRFAHGDGELRQVTARHPNYRSEWCETLRNGGVCPYYERCHFRHY